MLCVSPVKQINKKKKRDVRTQIIHHRHIMKLRSENQFFMLTMALYIESMAFSAGICITKEFTPIEVLRNGRIPQPHNQI